MFCPYCEVDQEITKVTRRESLPVLGEHIEFDAEVYKCNACNGEFATTDMDEENFRKAYNLYRDKQHLLRPERIKEIRLKYSLSQKDFSRFLGWGEITIHRYESGSLQDIAHNEILLLIDDPHNAFKILNLTRDHLSPTLTRKIENRIKELLANEDRTFLLPYLIKEENVVSVETGFKQFDLEKIENLILFIAIKCVGVLKTKLNKLLWYIDFKHFKDHTVGITGVKYIHLPLGPVPNDYELLTFKLQGEESLEAQELIVGDYTGENFVAKQDADMSLFNNKEIATINLVLERLGHLGSRALTDKSHEEPAYKVTTHRQTIPYSLARNLSI